MTLDISEGIAASWSGRIAVAGASEPTRRQTSRRPDLVKQARPVVARVAAEVFVWGIGRLARMFRDLMNHISSMEKNSPVGSQKNVRM